MDPKLTWTEVTYMCGVTNPTIRKWQRERGFPAPEAGKFSEAAVAEWCRINGVRTVTVQR